MFKKYGFFAVLLIAIIAVIWFVKPIHKQVLPMSKEDLVWEQMGEYFYSQLEPLSVTDIYTEEDQPAMALLNLVFLDSAEVAEYGNESAFATLGAMTGTNLAALLIEKAESDDPEIERILDQVERQLNNSAWIRTSKLKLAEDSPDKKYRYDSVSEIRHMLGQDMRQLSDLYYVKYYWELKKTGFKPNPSHTDTLKAEKYLVMAMGIADTGRKLNPTRTELHLDVGNYGKSLEEDSYEIDGYASGFAVAYKDNYERKEDFFGKLTDYLYPVAVQLKAAEKSQEKNRRILSDFVENNTPDEAVFEFEETGSDTSYSLSSFVAATRNITIANYITFKLQHMDVMDNELDDSSLSTLAVTGFLIDMNIENIQRTLHVSDSQVFHHPENDSLNVTRDQLETLLQTQYVIKAYQNYLAYKAGADSAGLDLAAWYASNVILNSDFEDEFDEFTDEVCTLMFDIMDAWNDSHNDVSDIFMAASYLSILKEDAVIQKCVIGKKLAKAMGFGFEDESNPEAVAEPASAALQGNAAKS